MPAIGWVGTKWSPNSLTLLRVIVVVGVSACHITEGHSHLPSVSITWRRRHPLTAALVRRHSCYSLAFVGAVTIAVLRRRSGYITRPPQRTGTPPSRGLQPPTERRPRAPPPPPAFATGIFAETSPPHPPPHHPLP